jgi:RNA polymerase sigma factor (sigma-70 family)
MDSQHYPECPVDINQLHMNARHGDPALKERLFSELSVRFRTFALLRIWNEQDAEEIVQDALMAVANEYNDLKVHTSFSAWAYAVLNNRMLNYFKNKKRAVYQSAALLGEGECELTSPHPDHQLRIKLIDCFKKIRQSNLRYARVVALHYQGYTVNEICRRLEVKRDNLYMILSRARAMLKACLDGGKTPS